MKVSAVAIRTAKARASQAYYFTSIKLFNTTIRGIAPFLQVHSALMLRRAGGSDSRERLIYRQQFYIYSSLVGGACSLRQEVGGEYRLARVRAAALIFSKLVVRGT